MQLSRSKSQCSIACAWLPDYDLTYIARDYGVTNLEPICQDEPPLLDALTASFSSGLLRCFGTGTMLASTICRHRHVAVRVKMLVEPKDQFSISSARLRNSHTVVPLFQQIAFLRQRRKPTLRDALCRSGASFAIPPFVTRFFRPIGLRLAH